MPEEIVKIKSITSLHQLLEIQPPQNPLISTVDVSKLKIKEELVGVRMSADFYYIGLKNAECRSLYGKNDYNFGDGVLAFTAPQQVITAKSTTDIDQEQGWMLFFHPDLLRGTSLGENISSYSFFDYDNHKTLHLSERENQALNDCIQKIKNEYEQEVDDFTQRVIISCIELLLNYCLRFYERQFQSAKITNTDTLIRVESIIKEYIETGLAEKNGIPTVSYIADKVNLSQNYLSDLLRKETGRSAKEHINDAIIDKAQSRLLFNPKESVAELAYSLGFKYPHYFIRLFKAKTGLTPQQYRKSKRNV